MMADWSPLPPSVTWTPDDPLWHGGMQYPSVTLRAPLAGDVQKATAVKGASPQEVTLRLISAVSVEQVPYEALQKLPHHLVEQMDTYMNLFGASPYPGPLDAWLQSRAAAKKAEAASAEPAKEPVAS